MKRIASLIAVLMLLLPSFAAPAFVYAEEAATPTAATTTPETETEAQKQERTVRLEAYKKTLKETLTNTVKTRIAARCVAAQALVKKHITISEAATKSRSTKYDSIVTRLETVTTNVGSEGINNLELEANVTELKAKVASFKTAVNTYEQSLDDASILDCKTDPTAFKAALETARTNQLTVLTLAKDIRTYLTDTIKPNLKALQEVVNANKTSQE